MYEIEVTKRTGELAEHKHFQDVLDAADLLEDLCGGDADEYIEILTAGEKVEVTLEHTGRIIRAERKESDVPL